MGLSFPHHIQLVDIVVSSQTCLHVECVNSTKHDTISTHNIARSCTISDPCIFNILVFASLVALCRNPCRGGAASKRYSHATINSPATRTFIFSQTLSQSLGAGRRGNVLQGIPAATFNSWSTQLFIGLCNLLCRL